MKKTFLCLAMGVACCLSGFVASAKENPPPPSGKPSPAGKPAPKGQPKAPGQNKKSKPQVSGQRRPAGDQDRGRSRGGRNRGRLSGQDERLIDAIDDADSLEQLMPLAQRARMAHSTDVRMSAVDALEARGRDCVNALAEFMDDPDPEVADSAFSAWSSILSDMKSHRRLMAVRDAAMILQSRVPPQGPVPGPVPVPVQGPVPGQVVVPVQR